MLLNKKICILIICFIKLQSVFSQQYEWNSARILLEIEKLNTTGSVLYIAAHPDDENTRLIAYMANGAKVRTGYLSLTRGDGGQNLIGDEQGAYLGVIRTQELLEARKVDGGEQFFTRAVDFGFSKSADETFTKWPHDSILADVVWVIRNFKPDIIITRFPPDARAGHGQHTVSAMLAAEAFDAAADPTKFPEQLKYVSLWQPQRLFWNNSVWWDKELQKKIEDSTKTLLSFDDGGYNNLLGKSYGEIAAESRTHHKSQGFGSTPTRGTNTEYLEQIKGPAFKNNDPFYNISTTWERYRTGSEIKEQLEKIIAKYDVQHPENSIPDLLVAYAYLNKLPTDALIQYKKLQLQNIIIASLGLWIEPVAEKDIIAQGDTLNIVSTALKRTTIPLTLESITILNKEIKVGEILPQGINQTDTLSIIIPDSLSSSPYWLSGNYDVLYNVANQSQRGKAQNTPALSVIYKIKLNGVEFTISKEVMYKETDAVKGEIYKSVALLPPATFSFDNSMYLFTSQAGKQMTVTVHKYATQFSGKLYFKAGDWQVSPEYVDVNFEKGETTKSFTFTVTPNSSSATNYGVAFMYSKNKILADEVNTIAYDHIPRQVIVKDASVKLIQLHAAISDKKIAYIDGAGDKVDESLRELGLHIDNINAKNITPILLKNYDVVLIGVRAYNTNQDLVNAKNMLMDYVENGGLVIAQYSNQDLLTTDYGPYPFTIGRGRVTDENSPVAFTDTTSPILNYPNKIYQDDFAGWIQERGLYFAENIAPQYKTVITFTDPNEKPQNGSIIIGDYGKGAYIYTGISFFRELPAGVPGAYKLFMNLLDYKNASH